MDRFQGRVVLFRERYKHSNIWVEESDAKNCDGSQLDPFDGIPELNGVKRNELG